MKHGIIKSLAIALLAGLLCCMTASAQTDSVKEQSGKKILIAYFSWGGNTQHVAEPIASLTGGTLFRIEPEKTVPHRVQALHGSGKRGKRIGCPV